MKEFTSSRDAVKAFDDCADGEVVMIAGQHHRKTKHGWKRITVDASLKQVDYNHKTHDGRTPRTASGGVTVVEDKE